MSSGLLAFAIFLVITYFIDSLVNHPVSIAGMETTGAVLLANIQMFLLGYPVAVLLVIPNAILADISEVDGHQRGINREAMFFGTQGLFMKINYGLASAIVAALFATYGKDVATPLGVKLSGPVASVFALVGFLVFFLYPQDWIEEKLKEIRSQEKKIME
jgi:GPH family glycoside/pentoside/hexuronide:cation symporter